MWICPVCKEKCEDDAEFCIMCGTQNPLIAGDGLNSSNYPWICPVCNNLCESKSRFCDKCGTPGHGIYNKERNADGEKGISDVDYCNSLIERGMKYLADGDFYNSKNLFNQVLNMVPEFATANLGMFMVVNGFQTEEDLREALETDFEDSLKNNKYWKRAKQFAADDLKEKLSDWEMKKSTPESQHICNEQPGLANPVHTCRKRNRLKIIAAVAIVTVVIAIILNLGSADIEKLSTIDNTAPVSTPTPTPTVPETTTTSSAPTPTPTPIPTPTPSPEASPIPLDDIEEINPEIGDIILFGSYEQDNDASNGKEDIEWIILDKEDNNILVISKYGLDCPDYDSEGNIWENCTIRTWLNDIFINNAFTSSEQEIIQNTYVTADVDPTLWIYKELTETELETIAGNDTMDKVFLLSSKEANEYFEDCEARQCAPTEYAIAQKAYTSEDYITEGKVTIWLLRPPGIYANVDYDGSITYGAGLFEGYYSCVRPAMWINLEHSTEGDGALYKELIEIKPEGR